MERQLIHNISETELIFRISKWVALCREKKAETEVEAFPEIRSDAAEEHGLLEKGKELARLGADLADKIADSGALKTVGRFVPGAGMAIGMIKWAAGAGKQDLKHQEIKEIAMRYLVILEAECRQFPDLESKLEKFQKEFVENCKEAEKKKSWF
jgi:hypothetical protein